MILNSATAKNNTNTNTTKTKSDDPALVSLVDELGAEEAAGLEPETVAVVEVDVDHAAEVEEAVREAKSEVDEITPEVDSHNDDGDD